MKNKVNIFFSFLIITIIVFSSISFNAHSKNYYEANFEKLDFRQEIPISIDTSRDDAEFQPIDIHIKFNNLCWAKNQTINSVRVAYDTGDELTELESQVYGLEFIDDAHISSCNVVFLIPEQADGNEKYYVLYDESETTSAKYPDHIVVEDSHYYYEPVSGQKADLKYYKIIEDGIIPYAVAYEGHIFGNGVSQTIAKMKPNTKKVEVSNMDQFASFSMLYSVDGEEEYSGTAKAKDTSKSILVDGNLMVKIKIEGVSPDGVVKTNNIYTYYYSPGQTKRISANVNHEVIKTQKVGGSKILDGTYANLLTFKSRSATIKQINIGDILPDLYLYSEDEAIKNYYIPPDPTSKVEEIVLSTTDDVDLGEKSWLCIHDPDVGKAHGLIFESNSGFLQGEEDGLQIGSFTEQSIKLPGLEVDVGNVFATRNYFEKGDNLEKNVPKGLNVNFNAEFVTFENEGFEAVDKESEIYQNLIKNRPNCLKLEDDKSDENQEKYTLNAYVHFAPSVPLGPLLCAAIGKNVPYIYAELYKDNNFESSGSVDRISLCSVDADFDDKNLVGKIKTVLNLFDWRNFSFFKKISFPNLTPGKYVVKIYRENPIFAEDRQYIGFSVVGLASSDSIHIYCRPQVSIKLSVFDQDEVGVENALFLLEKNEGVVAEAYSDSSGSTVLNVPFYKFDPYTLKVFYKGFLIEEKKVHIGLKNFLIQLSESFSINRYIFTLNVEDSWGLPPSIDLDPMLTSNYMAQPNNIGADESSSDKYIFLNVYSSEYILNLGYKSYELEEKIDISQDKKMDLTFPAEYLVDFHLNDLYGAILSEGEILISRAGQTRKALINDGKSKFSVPPGEYEITVISEDTEIAKQKIDVRGDKKVDIVSSKDSLLHNIVFYLGILLLFFSLIYVYVKRNIYRGLKLISIAFIVIAIVSSWWMVSGDDATISTNTNMYLFPSNIVTFVSSSEAVGGEIGIVPEEVTMGLSIIGFLLVASVFLIISNIVIKNKRISIITYGLIIFVLFSLISVFIYAMTKITEVSVGSIIGNGDLEITMPGIAENQVIQCSWGLGIGFYMVVLALISLAAPIVYKKIVNLKKCL